MSSSDRYASLKPSLFLQLAHHGDLHLAAPHHPQHLVHISMCRLIVTCGYRSLKRPAPWAGNKRPGWCWLPRQLAPSQPLQLIDRAVRLLDPAQKPVGVFLQQSPCLSQPHPASHRLEQRDAIVPLQFRTCAETAGWLMNNSSAARVKL